jgi:hypothetical protein
MHRQPATTGLQINRHRDGGCSRFCAGCRLACGPGDAKALGGLVLASPGAQARRQPAQNLEHPPKIHFYVHNCSRILAALICRGRRARAAAARAAAGAPAATALAYLLAGPFLQLGRGGMHAAAVGTLFSLVSVAALPPSPRPLLLGGIKHHGFVPALQVPEEGV